MVCNLWRLFEIEMEEEMAVYNIPWSNVKTDGYLMENVSEELVILLDKIDAYSGGKVIIHRLFDQTARKTSTHRKGLAADGHIEDLNVLDQYVLLERFSPPGLGLYPKDVWLNTGFHVDVRDLSNKPEGACSRWAYVSHLGGRKMVPINKDFFEHVIKLG